jgi:hypothetical protein
MYLKRLRICMLGGVISALICTLGSQILLDFPPMTWNSMASTIANRLLLGFVIGISSWGMNYLLHGAVIGFIVSITVSIGFLPGDSTSFVLYTIAGVLYGVMIEFLSTVVFKSPMRGHQSI